MPKKSDAPSSRHITRLPDLDNKVLEARKPRQVRLADLPAPTRGDTGGEEPIPTGEALITADAAPTKAPTKRTR